MAVVGIVALHLAVARRLAAYDNRLMVGVMPTAIVLQVALFRLIRAQERRRAFWTGFLTAGFLMMLSFGWATRFSTPLKTTYNYTTDTLTVGAGVPGYFSADQMRAI
ncbi:hypothetical protein SAMN05444166_6714 [Singulisphaera sp. GP187]|uniref:hypothetical protein n=1 Tax=Singulisphaera sp. GP187 TaxID=1882752 RepID=UPI00092A8B2E|nr:hypothetical protein [Singulisphaera sp. GP187]SIO61300.1 hypothetical protein SAMN05444166_6714 [Singulisphaera sp. GP187]